MKSGVPSRRLRRCEERKITMLSGLGEAVWAWRPRLSFMVLLAGTLAALGGTTACAVSESDVHRWETTESGPEKLYAIVTHDKYSWPLREEAALSLVRMRPRNGKRIGLEYLAIGYDTPQGRV